MLLKNLVIALVALASAAAAGQTFPNKPVRLIVGYAAGGGADALARILAPALAEVLGQQIVIENKPGAGSTLAASSVAKAQPDGYTLFYADAAFLTAPGMFGDLPYESERDFVPVAGTATLPLAIVVPLQSPIKTPAELIAAVKAAPNKFSYGTPGVGTLHHLTGELLKRMASLEWTHVPYRGAAAVLPDLIGGQLPVAIVSATAALPYAKAGRLRIVALTSVKRHPEVPEVPVLAEAVDGLNVSTDLFVLAPAATPAAVVGSLNKALEQVLQRRDIVEKLRSQGAASDWTTPDELASRIRRDIQKWKQVVKDSGVQAQR
jgi:tripartite-type tricarboxylate transporter receptor subunit TctC